jgi:formylmethanofuran dehydrogenase subunit C
MLTLTYRGSSTIPVEAECVTPDNLAGKTNAEVERLTLQHGNVQVPLAEFFAVSGDAGDGEVLVEGDCSRVKWLGAGMTTGRLTVRGPVGFHAGAEMRGGVMEVFGNAADWAGAEMRGGLLHVHGNVGHLAGAAYRGSRRGMVGGTLLIDGDAGNEVASTLRRGLVAVGGRCGDYAGVSMIAGTLLVFGPAGIRAAAGMKRGTVALLGEPAQLLPTFRLDCVYRPVFLQIYLRHLRARGFAVPDGLPGAELRRFSGDLVSLGKGEIFLRAA